MKYFEKDYYAKLLIVNYPQIVIYLDKINFLFYDARIGLSFTHIKTRKLIGSKIKN